LYNCILLFKNFIDKYGRLQKMVISTITPAQTGTEAKKAGFGSAETECGFEAWKKRGCADGY
jgi:hypothetical protein